MISASFLVLWADDIDQEGKKETLLESADLFNLSNISANTHLSPDKLGLLR